MIEEMKTWKNPIVRHRADPWVFLNEDIYYFIATVPEYNRIELRCAKALRDLKSAESLVVWEQHHVGSMCHHVWAPELHRINGKWYIYFAAADSEDEWKIRMYCLECEEASPMTTKWCEKGQIKTLWDSFSLDATTFELRGTRYLVWAQSDPKIPGNSNLYMDEMINPWTLAGKQIMITTPEYEWETVGYRVNEGPAALIAQGKVFLTYSASKTDHHYCMGLLEMETDKNPLEKENWVKQSQPVFATSVKNSQYGPGHNCFVPTNDPHRFIMIYHARNYKEITGDPLKDPNRHARAQIVRIEDGALIMGEPVKDGYYNMEEC